MAVDPVCKKEVNEKSAPGGKVNFWGKVFYFCTEECRKAFRRQPQTYAPEVAEGKGPGYYKDGVSDAWPH